MATEPLIGKIALIIGATGAIGGALAEELAERDCTLVLVGRNEKVLKELRNRLCCVTSDYWQCDISCDKDVSNTYESIINRFGRIDVVIFAAGIGEMMDGFHFSAQLFEKTIRVNLISLGYWLECIVPHMVQRGQGIIVGISSLAAGRGLPRGAAYCPSKAGVSVLFECLRIDLSRLGIHVLLVEPGFIASRLTTQLPFKPFIIPAKAAAQRIVHAIERRRSRIRFPWPIRIYAAVFRLLPRMLFDRVTGPTHPARAPLHDQDPHQAPEPDE